MARYYSPDGTWESIRKSVLEDPSLTDAEFRLALYLATKPDGWIARPVQIAKALERTESWARRTLTLLRKRGLVAEEVTREKGVIKGHASVLRKDAIVMPPKATSQPGTTAQDLRAGSDQPEQDVSPGHNQSADSQRVEICAPSEYSGSSEDSGSSEYEKTPLSRGHHRDRKTPLTRGQARLDPEFHDQVAEELIWELDADEAEARVIDGMLWGQHPQAVRNKIVKDREET